MRLTLSLLALAIAHTAPSAQEVLTGTYTYGQIGAEKDVACVLNEVVTFGALGTLTFFADGTVTASGVTHVSCSGGQIALQPTTVPEPGKVALYTLDDHGRLVVDFDAIANPGADTETFWLSWDRRVLVLDTSGSDETELLVAVREGAGLDESVLVGDWRFGQFAQERLAGVEVRVERGTVTYLPGGASQATASWAHMDECTFTTGSTPPTPGTYSVAASGALTLDGTWSGAVTDDGRFGFAVETQGSRTGMRLLLRDPITPVTPIALDDTWWAVQYDANSEAIGWCTGLPPVPPPWSMGVEPGSCFDQVVFDATAGSLVSFGSCAVTNGFGTELDWGGGQDTFSLAPTGEILFHPGAPDQNEGWLVRGEDLAFHVPLNDPGYLALGLILRGWGPLEATPDALSLTAGGTHTMTLRGGQANANALYLVLGSQSGTYPGIVVGGHVLPLNFDAYTQLTLQAPNTPPLGGTLGTLDALGRGVATFTLPAGSSPAFQGVVLHHAFALLDPADPDLVVFASNAPALDLLP